ncbi:MAG: sulfite exporter TauE/SafE family protein [Phycisphaerales bacterium JB065]
MISKTSAGSGGPRLGRLSLLVMWFVLFYGVWLSVVALGSHWSLIAEHWGIAVAMAIGSYFAGSTPMGGGTVGFPVLVLLFDEPARMGRDFSFAIQSIGMVSASVLIFCMRQPLETRLLKWSILGSAIGTPLGLAFIAPHAPDLLVKLIFATLWASFGMLHFAKIREISRMTGCHKLSERQDQGIGLALGVLAGSTIASTTGVGIDLALYIVIVLLSRADMKVAVPTSVVLMAATSVIGIATQTALSRIAPGSYALSDGLFANWLAAAPVVAIGAPVGVVMVRLVPRAFTLLVVSGLCLVQFFWTLRVEWEHLTTPVLAGTIAGLLALNLVFMLIYDRGKRAEARRLGDAATRVSGAHPEPVGA